MSYQVIARKWRPQRFDDVVGQQAVTRTLRNAIANGRIAQAFVFAAICLAAYAVARRLVDPRSLREPDDLLLNTVVDPRRLRPPRRRERRLHATVGPSHRDRQRDLLAAAGAGGDGC